MINVYHIIVVNYLCNAYRNSFNIKTECKMKMYNEINSARHKTDVQSMMSKSVIAIKY